MAQPGQAPIAETDDWGLNPGTQMEEGENRVSMFIKLCSDLDTRINQPHNKHDKTCCRVFDQPLNGLPGKRHLRQQLQQCQADPLQDWKGNEQFGPELFKVPKLLIL